MSQTPRQRARNGSNSRYFVVILLFSVLTVKNGVCGDFNQSTTTLQLGIISGTTALYHFNESSGTSLLNEMGGRTGTITGTTWVVGSTDSFRYPYTDTYLSFGNTSLDFVDVGASNFANTVDCTFEFWVKRSSQQTDDCIFGFDSLLTKRFEITLGWVAPGVQQLYFYLSDSVNTYQVLYPTKYNASFGWHYITAFSSGTSMIGVSIDDNPDVTFTTNTLTMSALYVAANSKAKIGQLGDVTGSNPFGGFIAEARFSNTYIPKTQRIRNFRKGPVVALQ